MKLQKQLSRKVGTTEYAKYVIVVPPETIKQVGWNEGEDLRAEIKGNKLVIGKS